MKITDVCIGCGLCKQVCPVYAISGEGKGRVHIIEQEVCIECGACMVKCPLKAITKG